MICDWNDDSDDFLTEIHKRYGTRFDGFEWGKYFQPDGEAQFDFLPRLFGLKPKTKPLRVGHLLDVIIRVAWFEPPAGWHGPVTPIPKSRG